MTVVSFTAPVRLQLAAAPPAAAPAPAGVRTVSGLAVPWGQEFTRLGGIRFVFTEQSLRLPDDLSTVSLLLQHDDDRPIGYGLAAESTRDGLWMTFALPDHPRTDDAVTELQAGLRTGLSVGVEIDQSVLEQASALFWDDGDVDEPIEMAGLLREVSQVTVPQFNSARVMARAATPTLLTAAHPTGEDPSMSDTPTPPVETSTTPDDVATLSARVEHLETRALLAHVTEPPPPVDVRAAFTDLVTAYGANRANLALADMVTTGNAGLLPIDYRSEIISYLDSARYFVSQAGRSDFPATGTRSQYPKVTQHTQVGDRGAEKSGPPSRALTTDWVYFDGQWYAGVLDISYELIRTASRDVVAFAVEDMLAQAAIDSEMKFVAKVEDGATAGGAAISFTDYKAFVTSVRAAVRAVRAATGVNQPKVAMTSASFDKLLTLVDGDNRRALAASGGVNSDGASLLTDQAVSVAGVYFFESPHSTVDVAFNTKALRAAELPPQTLSADNVPLLGRDVAVLGNIITEIPYPAGVIKFAAETP